MFQSFSQWMAENTHLSDSSIYKYQRAIHTISNEMLEAGVIYQSLLNMTRFELDIAINVIFQNPQFIAKNEKGRRMYSNALKQYRYFIADAIDAVAVSNDQIATEKQALTKMRIGQNTYRNGLMEKYDGRCIVTGIHHPKLLIASHIKPWSVCENNERVDVENGLLLSANMDKLFDCGLITFHDNGKLYISSFVGQSNATKLQITNDTVVDLKASHRLCEYLQYHRDVLFIG